jgi:hypothetical protein
VLFFVFRRRYYTPLFLYIILSHLKAVLSRFNSRAYKYTTHTTKSRYKQNLRHYSAYQNKKLYHKIKNGTKTPPTMPRKRFTSSENKNGIQEHTPTKRKSLTERKNALQGIKKSRPRSANRERLYF